MMHEYDAILVLQCIFIPTLETQDEHMQILQEAASVKAPGRQKRLEKETKQAVSKEQVTVSIMADLQQQQDKESENMIQQLPEKVRNGLTFLVQYQGFLLFQNFYPCTKVHENMYFSSSLGLFLPVVGE